MTCALWPLLMSCFMIACRVLCFISTMLYVMSWYKLCYVISHTMIRLCNLMELCYVINVVSCMSLYKSCHINHVSMFSLCLWDTPKLYMLFVKVMASTMYVCLIGILFHEKNGGISCTISICHDLKLWGPHAFCMSRESGYFLVMISTKTYTIILCTPWYYVRSFPSATFLVPQV